MGKKTIDKIKNTNIESKYEVVGDFVYNIITKGPEINVYLFEKSFKIYDKYFKDILIKHFGALSNPSIHMYKDRLTVRLDNIKLKNGISYANLEEYFPEDWENFYNHLRENFFTKTNGGKDLENAYKNDPELYNKLDTVLTKIENL